MASQFKCRAFESRCGQDVFSFCKSRFRSLQQEEAHANEINHDKHLANTLFKIKVRQKKNVAAVCSGISLFMLGLTLIAKKIASSPCRFASLGIDYEIAV